MGITRDLSDLPREQPRVGTSPVAHPKIVDIVAQTWFDDYLAKGQDTLGLAIPDAGPYRASYASKRCDRSLYYALTHEPASNPSTISDYWRFGIGTMVHDAVQSLLPGKFPHSKMEVLVNLNSIGIPGSAHVDVVLYDDETLTTVDRVVELKSINGFGFKTAATSFKGPPDGPRWGAVVQGAMVATALEARNGLIVGYLSLESMSPDLSSYAESEIGRFAAEWEYTAEQCAAITAKEAARIQRVLMFVENGSLPARELHDPEYPVGAVVTNGPAGKKRAMWEVRSGGTVQQFGTTWMCGYCDHQAKCFADHAGGWVQPPLDVA